MNRGLAWISCVALGLLSACASPTDGIIAARMIDAGFPEGDASYKCVFRASDGKVYYAICCHRIDTHAQMFVYDPARDEVKHLADLGEVVGEKGKKTVPQGKVHVNIFEHQRKLYTATHIGYYKPLTSKEEPGVAEGYKPYPGGHFISYDLDTGRFEDLAKAPSEEGIITMIMDKQRGRLYGLTWPGGLFVYYDLSTKKFKDCGPVFGKGERGKDGEWMLLCRTFGLDPRDGSVYWSNIRGEIGVYRTDRDAVETVAGCSLNVPAMGGAAIWRSIVWVPKENAFYGLHSAQSHLFRFDPAARRVEPLERLVPERTAGSPTLAFQLGPDGETIYYLTMGPDFEAAHRKYRSTVHFMTCHIPSKTVRDHGVLRLDDGRYPVYVQSIDSADGMVNSVLWISKGVKFRIECREGLIHIIEEKDGMEEEINLIRFPDPYLRK